MDDSREHRSCPLEYTVIIRKGITTLLLGDKIFKWLKDNIASDDCKLHIELGPDNPTTYFYFRKEEDAVLFKLIFGGE